MDEWKVIRKKVLISSLIIYGVLIVAGFLVPEWHSLNWGLVVLFGTVAHFFFSIKTVNPDEWGLVIFFGQVVFQADEGWVLTPEPFFRLEKVPKGFKRVEFGSPFTDRDGKLLEKDPDEGRKGVDIIIRQPFRPNFLTIESMAKKVGDQSILPDEPHDLPDEYRLPEITEQMLERFRDDPMHRAITPDLQFFFIMGVKDAAIFYRRVEGKTVEEKLMNVAHMITDQGKQAILEVAGKVSLGIFRAYQGQVNRRLRYRVEQILGEEHTRSEDPKTRMYEEEHHPYLGINLIIIAMKDPGLPFHVNDALSKNAAAGYQKTTAIALSEGEKVKRENEGLGTAAAEESRLKAIAAGVAAMAEIARNPEGELAMRVRAAENAITGGNVTLLPIDLSGLAGAVAAIKSIPVTTEKLSK